MGLAETRDLVKKAADRDASPREVLNSLPVISEPRCNVCKSEFRGIIDRMIAGPYSYAAIARQFIGKDEPLRGDITNKRDMDRVRKSIERHARSHVSVRDQAVREIIEERAREAGMLVDEQKSQYLTSEALLELYIAKGYEQITNENVLVKHQDILEAVKMVEEMRKDTVNEQLEMLKRQVWAISKAVRDLVPPELHPELISRAQELFDMPALEMESGK